MNNVIETEQNNGRPPIRLSDKIFCSVLKVYGQKPCRQSETLFEQALKNKYITKIPNFKTLSKTLTDEKITPILYRLVELSTCPLWDFETNFAIDSTGFRCSTFGAYCELRHNIRRKHNWLKVYLCVGIKSNIVTAVKITKETAGDSPQLEELIKTTAKYFYIREVYADPAYCSRKNYNIIDSLGGDAYILFRKSDTGYSKGSIEWKRKIKLLRNNPKKFKEKYNNRFNVESTISAMKMKLGETIKSRNKTAQVNEMLCKIIAYNITVLIRAMMEYDINPQFSL